MHCNTVKIFLSLLLFVLMVVEMPVDLKAQRLLSVNPGSRVRLKIDNDSSWLVGIYQGRRADSLRIVLSGEPETKLFKLANISEVEVSRGRFRHIRKGALIGAAIGAGVGVVGVIFGTGGFFDATPAGYLMVVGTLAGAGAVTGGLSGVVIGIVSGESWTPVSLKWWSARDMATTFRVGYGFRF